MKREDMEQLPELEISRIAMEKNTRGMRTDPRRAKNG